MTPEVEGRAQELMDRIRAAGLSTDGSWLYCTAIAEQVDDPARQEELIDRHVTAMKLGMREQRIRRAIQRDPRFPSGFLDVPLHRRLVREAAEEKRGAELIRSYAAMLEGQATETDDGEGGEEPGGYLGLPPANDLFD